MNAVLALVLNTVVLMAALSYFHAVLTLPGIAGIILTIGMAVDSNVLIFERIREELRTGKSVIAAVDAGFGKAWWTIVDTHVTTVVSCAFLFLFGEGPVRGFAVTLVIGLIANVFTAVFVSKTIFDYELSGRRQLTGIEHLSGALGYARREQNCKGLVSKRFEAPARQAFDGNIQEHEFRFSRQEVAVHHCLAGADGGRAWQHRHEGRRSDYGIDFKGGTLMTVKFADQPAAGEDPRRPWLAARSRAR